MKKKILGFAVIIIGLACIWYFFINDRDQLEKSFSFVEVTKGDIITKITSSGTIQAVSTVEVGTQVSGKIENLYVDFNDKVRKGQLLAKLDTTFLAAAVKDAEASLARANAQLEESISKHQRNEELYKKGYLAELDFIVSKTAVTSAKASVQSAESSLERANTNLDYAYIYSPISGTVINRNVEVGQTVAASLSAPTLFNIAEDLSRMEILAEVDESDIGQIKEGQFVSFTVQAYPDKEFKGEVRQIRLQPQNISNVINYTVVVSTENKERYLLPGMTATVDFYVDEKRDVLLVPSMAFRFKPSEEIMADFQNRMKTLQDQVPDSIKQRRLAMQPNSGAFGGGFGDGGRKSMSSLWYFDDNGNLNMSRVITGATDGKSTEIVRGRNISEGMKVISAQVTSVSNSRNETPPMPPRGFGRGF